MSKVCTVATAVLNQWALDFKGNLNNIIESIRNAKLKNARYRGGPELEICGYGCQDHFYEPDTLLHSWEVLREIIIDKSCYDIVIDVGMPVAHKGAIYNCRVICFNGKVVFIRPKQILAVKGVYREDRWFNPWQRKFTIEDYVLPEIIQCVQKQKSVPFGDALLCFNDTCVGIETCHELWAQRSPNTDYYLAGADILFNGNGSNHILRKLDERQGLIESATKKFGGVYVYTNLRGCDSERVYFDGGAMISMNGEIIAQGEQFSLKDVEVLCATFDLNEIRTYRYQLSNGISDPVESEIPRIYVDFSLAGRNSSKISRPIKPSIIPPEKEISLAPAFWLWDNLRRSGMNGFFLPLSGGLDSSSVACIVYSMCVEIVREISAGNERVLVELRKIVGDINYKPINAKELCSKMLVTCYMGSENSSDQTRNRAKLLASQIGSSHLDLRIDGIVSAFIAVVVLCFGRQPKFVVNGGTKAENFALQNVQARIRMVLAYFLAQLYFWSVNRGLGGLLVLASGNLDECLRGYLTKYDCSSADLNPIGSICKNDLKMFIRYCINTMDLSSLSDILSAPPTAELEPLNDDGQIAQLDEVDMGMTYDELSVFGKLRKIKCCGPYFMFMKLLDDWQTERGLSAREIADKVKHFFNCYSKNRHKMTVITPSYHVESYDCDDNRFDLRPFLYNAAWTWQFERMDYRLLVIEGSLTEQI